MSRMNALEQLEFAMAIVRSAPDREFQRKRIHDILRDQVRPAVARLEQERDGWRAIATELLRVAIGKDWDGADGTGARELPPLEIIEVRDRGGFPAQFVAALEQFWADVTRKHEARRARHTRIWVGDRELTHVRSFELDDQDDPEPGADR